MDYNLQLIILKIFEVTARKYFLITYAKRMNKSMSPNNKFVLHCHMKNRSTQYYHRRIKSQKFGREGYSRFYFTMRTFYKCLWGLAPPISIIPIICKMEISFCEKCYEPTRHYDLYFARRYNVGGIDDGGRAGGLTGAPRRRRWCDGRSAGSGSTTDGERVIFLL